MRIALLTALFATAAGAENLCGITARVCRSAETRVRSRYTVPPGDWYLTQEWTPWSISIDPGTKSVDLRFRFGGHADNQGGVAYADSEEQTRHHEIQSCKGSVASGKVELEIGDDQTVELIFEKGKLVRVNDPTAHAQANYGVAMVAREEHLKEAINELEWEARNVTFACPGGGESLFGASSQEAKTGGGGASKGKGKKAAQTPASTPEFEKTPTRTEPQSRQETTGEQGGAGGASSVDYGPEVHAAARAECVEKCGSGWLDCHNEHESEFKDCLHDQPYEENHSLEICSKQAYGTCDDARESCKKDCE